MALSITPTLSSGSGYLTDVRDQVASLVRFIIMNPGGTSDIWEDQLISFRYLSARYDTSRDTFCAKLTEEVSNLLERKFPDYVFDVNFSSSDYSQPNDVRYTVGFSIIIDNANGVVEKRSALVDGSIFVDKSTNEITLDFNKSADTSVFN